MQECVACECAFCVSWFELHAYGVVHWVCLGYRKMNPKRMLKNYSRVNLITGGTGRSLEEETVCIFGVMLLLWNSLMVAMDGSDLSWMGSWPQCIPVGVLKEDLTVQVQACSQLVFKDIVILHTYIVILHILFDFEIFCFTGIASLNSKGCKQVEGGQFIVMLLSTSM